MKTEATWNVGAYR